MTVPTEEEAPVRVEAEAPLWRQSLRLVWHNRRVTLLPMVVTQVPLAVVAATAWALLLGRIFPNVPVDQPTALAEDAPNALLACLFAWSWIYGLFTLVGVGGNSAALRFSARLAAASSRRSAVLRAGAKRKARNAAHRHTSNDFRGGFVVVSMALRSGSR